MWVCADGVVGMNERCVVLTFQSLVARFNTHTRLLMVGQLALRTGALRALAGNITSPPPPLPLTPLDPRPCPPPPLSRVMVVGSCCSVVMIGGAGRHMVWAIIREG